VYKKDWESDELPNAHLIGNLPFNIATPLLFKLLTKVSDQTGVKYLKLIFKLLS
jgi:16S rRNA A1518/A1519 N6-dimethyltransferase RsmA/KsgA/DIM1 with predicted DNA glycosylase/AP lyase activity